LTSEVTLHHLTGSTYAKCLTGAQNEVKVSGYQTLSERGNGGPSPVLRLLQEYAGGSLSFSAFSSQWQTILTQAATPRAATNKVHITGL
jgi:hypothetical protein